jgi:GNAT superfamily N-acetyltransferase
LIQFRPAGPDDADQIAALHADSWRRYYRGAFADSFLDGDIATERRAVWTSRLAAPTGTATILAERDGEPVGFVHVAFDDDPRWGSLVDNLHVRHSHRRTGIGRQLLARAAQAAVSEATGNALYLWVLQQNTEAQKFYLAIGANSVETAPVPPPGGDPARLNGHPLRLRMAWPDASLISGGPQREP